MSDILVWRIYDTVTKSYVRPSNSQRSMWENPGPVGSLLKELNDPEHWRGSARTDKFPGRYERHCFELRRIVG